ncbi:hypothetical protein FB451DRAFT_70191 [Mycena latifolia]|nr:hypothetical protein FB451DRAFT_70191 [Mycena latifolia]
MANYAMIAFTYLRFTAALKAQNISRDSLPRRSPWQPFCGYYAFTASFTMIFLSGYAVFLPGRWNAATFVFSSALVTILPAIFFGWKLGRGTKVRAVPVPGSIRGFLAFLLRLNPSRLNLFD